MKGPGTLLLLWDPCISDSEWKLNCVLILQQSKWGIKQRASEPRGRSTMSPNLGPYPQLTHSQRSHHRFKYALPPRTSRRKKMPGGLTGVNKEP